MARRVVIASAVRTAIGGFEGAIRDVPAYKLGQAAIAEAVKRAKINPVLIDDVRMGCCMEPIEAMNCGRVAALLAKVPDSVPATTLNRVCTSALEAVASGASMILSGNADVILAGGMESMSNAPYVLTDMRWGARMMDKKCVDGLIHGLHAGSQVIRYPKDADLNWARGKEYIMGLTAEFLALKYKISRKEQDEVALKSHNSAENASKTGRFKDEITAVTVVTKKGSSLFETDEHFRVGLTAEQLAKLPPAFIPGTGTVTAGNSSGINNGASAMVLLSEAKAKELGITPLAYLDGTAMGGCAPEVMGESPVPACHKLFKKTGTSVKDYDLVELNEAFASQYIACEKQLGWKREIANVNGGGIGLGHPVGSSGCRIMVTLIHEMRKRNVKRGLATICGGGGVGMAAAISLP